MNFWDFERLSEIKSLAVCKVMATEEKPLNPLDSSHGGSSPASNQVHIQTHTHRTYACVDLGFKDLIFERCFFWLLIKRGTRCVCKRRICGIEKI